MSTWSLPTLLSKLHDDIEHRLNTARAAIGHPTELGDGSEKVWIAFFEEYLPKRYQAAKATIVDSEGKFSQQIDVVIFDRQYTPFVWRFKDTNVIPAESVYAVFEAKQSLNAGMVAYAQEKAASVRQLHRTSLPIPHAGGTYAPKPLIPILGGVLAFESDWKPPLGGPLLKALQKDEDAGRLDIGCIASHGMFAYHPAEYRYSVTEKGKPATAFLLELIARLQASATVPMIDIRAYSRWLAT